MRFTSYSVLADLAISLVQHRPFSTASLGDGEIMYYMHPELAQIPDVDTYLRPNGVNSGMVRLKEDSLRLLPSADYVFVHKSMNELTEQELAVLRNPATPVWARYFNSWPLILQAYKFSVRTLDAGLRYKMIQDGTLQDMLRTTQASVLLVGHQAKLASAGLEGCKITGVLETGVNNGGDIVKDLVLEAIRSVYFDVALVGMGIAANYFCLQLKELGRIALNIGTGMNLLAKVDTERTDVHS